MPDYKEGMLIFQPLPAVSRLVRVIQDATDSKITHVGILHKNENGKWVVIESIGNNGEETPIDNYLIRSSQVAWYKNISGLSESATSVFVNEAIRLTKKYPKYDAEFEYGNNSLYCSELVALAAKSVGVDLFDTDVRASWLDTNDKSTAEYLRNFTRPKDMEKWRILPPHTLFYSDRLEDTGLIGNSTQQTLREPVPNHALYDTLPGKTTQDKMAYLEKKWGKYAGRIVSEKEIVNGHTHHLFKLNINNIEYGLILFGQFYEEELLAKEVLKRINKR